VNKMRVSLWLLLFVVLATAGFIECRFIEYRIYDREICRGDEKYVTPSSLVTYVSTIDVLSNATDVDQVLNPKERNVIKPLFDKCLKEGFNVEQLPKMYMDFHEKYCEGNQTEVNNFGKCFNDNLKKNEPARTAFKKIDAYVKYSAYSKKGVHLLFDGKNTIAHNNFRTGSNGKKTVMTRKHYNAAIAAQNKSVADIIVKALKYFAIGNYAKTREYIEGKLTKVQKKAADDRIDALYFTPNNKAL